MGERIFPLTLKYTLPRPLISDSAKMGACSENLQHCQGAREHTTIRSGTCSGAPGVYSRNRQCHKISRRFSQSATILMLRATRLSATTRARAHARNDDILLRRCISHYTSAALPPGTNEIVIQRQGQTNNNT